MLSDLEPLLNHLPPKTATALVQAITRCSNKLGVGPDWVQRWISFTVVADALASYAPAGQPVFEFKGGVAIEMRLRRLSRADIPEPSAVEARTARPRATKDLDATYRGTMDTLEAAVRDALVEPRHHFGFRVETERSAAPFMRRFRIRVSYREERFGRIVEQSFNSVKLEISIYEGARLSPEMVPAFSLKPFGFDGPECLPCIPLAKQIAQKLHAVTERPPEGKANDRFRDLLDIVLLSALAPPSPELHAACAEIFTIRGKQTWPPEIVTYPQWVKPLEQQAEEMGLDHRSAEDIVAHVAEYVRQIANVV